MKKIAIAVIAWSAIGAHAQAPTQAIVPFPPGGALEGICGE
jgi:hypothetical protein